METTELKMIKLSALVPSKTNPRKLFDEAALQELAASIKEKGVLQPIVVRKHGKTKYEVVCGERRYRASQLAEVETIPAVIRDLHDDEALELQIVENLQRKDVHPMDEAAAFLNLSSVFKMGTGEIALRVGKSIKYVVHRLKLNDLIPDFQEMFYQDRMTLGEAIKLSRTSEEAQREIHREETGGQNWREDEDFRLRYVNHYVGQAEINLDKATFKTEDADLYPEAGACGSCRHNSANSPLLFEDQQSRICTNPVCFRIKRDRAFQQNLEKVATDPEVLIVSKDWNGGGEGARQAKEMGVNVIPYKAFNKVSKPEHPGSWEEYLREETKWMDEGDITEEVIAEAREDYDVALSQYQEEVKEYDAALASGEVRRAFVVDGHGEVGTFIDVKLNDNGQALAEQVPDGAAEEIAEIQTREARAKELDQEKIYKRVCEELKACEEYTGSSEAVKAPECIALALMLEGFGGYGMDDFLKKEGIEVVRYQWDKKQLYEKLVEKLTPELLNKIIRYVLLQQLITGTEINPEKHGKAMAIMGIAEHYLPDRVKEIRLEQQEKAAKRAARVKQRIEALKKKEVEA